MKRPGPSVKRLHAVEFSDLQIHPGYWKGHVTDSILGIQAQAQRYFLCEKWL